MLQPLPASRPIFCGYGVTMILPTTRPSSMYRMASAASPSGNVRPMIGVSCPAMAVEHPSSHFAVAFRHYGDGTTHRT